MTNFVEQYKDKLDDLVKILEDNPGADLILDNDCFWICKDIEAGGPDDHWADVEGNELYSSVDHGMYPAALIMAFAQLNGMTVHPV